MAGTDDNGTPPATPKPAAGGTASLTARETEILHAALNCVKAPIEIDYALLAGAVGMTNPRSASNAWTAIKKKMRWVAKADDTPATGKSGGGAKRKKAATTGDAGDDGDNDDDDEGTPVKKPKAPTKPRKTAAADPKKNPASAKKGKAAAVYKSAVFAKDSSEEDELAPKEKQVAKPVKTEEFEDQGNGDGEV